MSSELLCTADAARRLGICVATLYDWLAQSDAGEFQLRGQPVTIAYFQGGRNGQGRIKISAKETDRLLAMMEVKPGPKPKRNPPRPRRSMQHITTTPGRPTD